MKDGRPTPKDDLSRPGVIVRNGVHILPKRDDGPVTSELVQHLLDEEDEERIERFHRGKPPE